MLLERADWSSGSWRVRTAWAGTGPGGEGGDRLLVEHSDDGSCCFAVVDVAGSGSFGERQWKEVGPGISSALAALSDGELSLEGFGQQANARLDSRNVSAAIVAGRVSATRSEWATWGWGTHALISRGGVPIEHPRNPSRGIKLGWLDPVGYAETPASFVGHSAASIDRLVVFTDGLLVDDHREVETHLRFLAELDTQVARSDTDVIDVLLGKCEFGHDDLAILWIERFMP